MMHSLLVLIDGLGDDAIEALQGRTPFEAALHPVMDAIEQNGGYGSFNICEDDLVPESSSCIARLLGVGKEAIPKNRAYLELLAQNRDISEYEMVLRCNLAVVDKNGKLLAFNGQGLSAAKMKEAAEAVGDIRKDIEFLHLSEYRNLLILDKKQAVLDCPIPPPHESVGENVNELLAPLRQTSLAINYFLEQAEKRLEPFNHDDKRYILYPWGPSDRQGMPAFRELHGLSGGAVCKAEIVRGIAQALQMECVVPATATGDVDTDITAKAAAALALLEHNDFVIAHFNGTDEAAHRYDFTAKADMVTRIDAQFLLKILSEYEQPLKVVICGDHVTSSITGKHGHGPTPVIAGYLNYPKTKPIELNSYRDILKFLMKESD